jgi:hypothetical protein
LELTTLCGPKSYVAERIEAFKEAGVTHLQVYPVARESQTLATLIETVKTLV